MPAKGGIEATALPERSKYVVIRRGANVFSLEEGSVVMGGGSWPANTEWEVISRVC